MGETCITIAQKTNDKARMALASFAHALFERESYAIARIVTKDSNDPRLVLLAPLIDVNLKALIDVPIPFAEDVRAFKFPPLDVVNTVSGATRTKHRYLPEEDLLSAMSDYVDSMDLSTLGRDDEGYESPIPKPVSITDVRKDSLPNTCELKTLTRQPSTVSTRLSVDVPSNQMSRSVRLLKFS